MSFTTATNLSLITKDGRFYSFDIVYNPTPIHLSFDISRLLLAQSSTDFHCTVQTDILFADTRGDSPAVIKKKVVVKLSIFLKIFCLRKFTGISYIDSTPIRVCHIKREKQHKVFKEFAQKGQCSLGWFYEFKLHLIINDKGEILDFIITPSNIDDRKPLSDMNLHKRIFGKLFGDKGYISKDLFEQLFIDGVHLITKIKKNMKNSLMLLQDKITLRKRALIETVNDELKNICQVEHTRHRSFDNFVTNLLSGLIAYSFFDKKPSINLQEDIVDLKRLVAA